LRQDIAPQGIKTKKEREEKMANIPEKTDKGRRDFLKLAGATAPAAVAAAALGASAGEAEAAPAKPGLQDTDHTRAYFASARF
jgi:hypothetical protein